MKETEKINKDLKNKLKTIAEKVGFQTVKDLVNNLHRTINEDISDEQLAKELRRFLNIDSNREVLEVLIKTKIIDI